MTLRQDGWWVQPLVIFSILTAFVVYVTWAAFQNKNYYVGASYAHGARDLLSPLYSPCIAASCVPGASHHVQLSWWNFSPALLILFIPGGFRVTCYYYRRSYYRAFWGSPPACAVQDAHGKYTGETRFPLILQNSHRYFFYLAFLVNFVLTYDAVVAFHVDGGIGVTVGTIVLVVNAGLLWLYTLSCHACRHLCGGHVRKFSDHPIRQRFWKWVTPLNAKHMQIAWVSLIVVALADVYVRLVASGAITDVKLF
ncbi:MAG TPA: hypothetical protein VIE15_03665 [Acidimicrobiales bacterium]|jgi:hypothetical protein